MPRTQRQPIPTTRRTSAPQVAPRPRSFRVAIVDDEPDIHLSVQYVLEGSEFVLDGCYLKGRDALEGIGRNPPDLVLMDIRLPDISGIECTRRLMAAQPDLRIIMLSALDDRRTVDDATRAGCLDYLTKPFGSKQCLTTLRCVLNRTAREHPAADGPPVDCPLHRTDGVATCFRITEREARALHALARGLMYKEIATEIQASQFVVHKLIHRAFGKLGVHTRHQATERWLRCSRCSRCSLHFTGHPAGPAAPAAT